MGTPFEDFADFAAKLKGDEKSEAQTFLLHLLTAFGHGGNLPDGASFEYRVKFPNSHTKFADFVWPKRTLIEMKSRGENLQKHYGQVKDYWWYLGVNRPDYVVLSNFDEFWIYDFVTQPDTPKDVVKTAELPQRWGPLKFLEPGNPKPVFGNDHEAVTLTAAAKLGELYKRLGKRGIAQPLAQRFILQMLVALFADDIGLLPRYFLTELLDDCATPAAAYDLLGDLFTAMNTTPPVSGGRFKGVRYFNGGLFAQPARIELTDTEIVAFRELAKADWSKVQPEIFGTLFEQSTDERRAFGQHFTRPVDIMKIVRPTIVEPWRDQIESAKTLKRLGELRERLHNFRVLDPACGSGNFLYIAYRELKRLEVRIVDRINTEFPSRAEPDQRQLSFLSAQNFFGLDINPLAVELAKVTMMIGRKLAIEELHISEPDLPLDNLDTNFRCADALFTDWPKVAAIIGNPPFIGAKLLKPQHGPDYVNKVRAAYPDVPGMADYCVYWFRKVHDHLPACTAADPVAGRAGLVGTQNVRNNQSRVGGLDHVVKTGTIVEAVDNQPWSGEANVHVSIVNWIKTHDAALLPKTRRLWFKLHSGTGVSPVRPRRGVRADKTYELDCRECAAINSALSDQTDVAGAKALSCNTEPQHCFNGQMLGHAGFLLTAEQRAMLLRKDPQCAAVIYPYLNGLDALTASDFDRFVLDFEQMSQLDAAAFAPAFAWVKTHVLPDRERKAKEGVDKDGKIRPHHKAFLSRWWQLSFGRPEMLSVIKPLPRYLTCAYVTKRPIFMFVSSAVRPSNLIQVFGFADDYSFGILQSSAHWLWFVTKCGKLKSDFRYSAESVFDTFPWPQFAVGTAVPTVRAGAPDGALGQSALPTTAITKIEAVAAAGREVRRIRAEALTKLKGGLRALYRTLELPGTNPLKDAHAALDAAVLAAYGFDPKQDLLAQLLALNFEVAGKIAAGHPVTAPGIPPGYLDASKLVTADCLQPGEIDE